MRKCIPREGSSPDMYILSSTVIPLSLREEEEEEGD